MTFSTQFELGDRVQKPGGKVFKIGQVRIQTLSDGDRPLILIEYRWVRFQGKSPSYGSWCAEKYLRRAA